MPGSSPSIRNLSREAAEAFSPGDNVVCISITQPREPARLSRRYWAVLWMEFADWDVDRYPNQPHGNGNPALSAVFQPWQADRIKNFAEFARGAHIVVHCDAGVSRSAAVVEAIMEAFPEYVDAGGARHPNHYVRRLTLRAFGIAPSFKKLITT